jgi:hypothetical protein
MFNTDRTLVTEPTSLTSTQGYKSKDVYDALHEIFYKKCYLCESINLDSINIEHFIPHRGDKVLQQDWNNIYLACGRCNNCKLALPEFDILLDCCNAETDVFKAIKLLPPHSLAGKTIYIKAMNGDEGTSNTVNLLNKIFNSTHTIEKTLTSKALREKVFKQCLKFQGWHLKYSADDSSPRQINEASESMKELMKKEKAYSAFIRWIILDDDELAEKFKGYMD